MPMKCSLGPLRMPNESIKVMLPMVKDKANLCGWTDSKGTPTKKAKAKKRADKNNSPQKTCLCRERMDVCVRERMVVNVRMHIVIEAQ